MLQYLSMMAIPFKTIKVNLIKYPETIRDNSGNTVTLGDMHSNTMKLIWCLIKAGIIKFSPEDFKELWTIYQDLNSTSLNISEKLDRFTSILDNIIVNPDSHLRLLGDVLGDRGTNDFLTLMLLKKLKEDGLNYEMIYSNHDDFLLQNYNRPTNKWKFHNVHNQQNAMVNLHNYIKLGLIDQTKIVDIIDTCVIPTMKLISYSLSEDKKSISLFMHAPNNFSDIKNLAMKFGVIDYYQPESAFELTKLIDKINEAFSQFKNPLPTQGDYAKVTGASFWKSSRSNKQKETIKRFIWNRLKKGHLKERSGKIDVDAYPNFVSYIVHGHTKPSYGYNSKQINLNSQLGEGPGNLQEKYISFRQPGKIKPTLPTAYNTAPIDPIKQANIRRAERWMLHLHEFKAKNSLSTDDQKKIVAVIDAANTLLDNYTRNKPIPEQDELAKKFNQAVMQAQTTLPRKMSWKNLLNVFIFIPSIANLIKTKGKDFWIRKPKIKVKQFEQILI